MLSVGLNPDGGIISEGGKKSCAGDKRENDGKFIKRWARRDRESEINWRLYLAFFHLVASHKMSRERKTNEKFPV